MYMLNHLQAVIILSNFYYEQEIKIKFEYLFRHDKYLKDIKYILIILDWPIIINATSMYTATTVMYDNTYIIFMLQKKL